MRILAGCLLFAAASVVIAPGPEDLRNRYGAPVFQHHDESGKVDVERFRASIGTAVTANYGSDGRACHLGIGMPAPKDPPFAQTKKIPSADKSSPVTSDPLEEWAPTALRGKLVNSGTFQSSQCGGGSMFVYENVYIVQGLSFCERGTTGATIDFLRDVCPRPADMPHTPQQSTWHQPMKLPDN
jgi:hypothetical protein